MENMDKGLTVPKWVLIVWPKISQMPQNLSAQFVHPSPKVLDFNEKKSFIRRPWVESADGSDLALFWEDCSLLTHLKYFNFLKDEIETYRSW